MLMKRRLPVIVMTRCLKDSSHLWRQLVSKGPLVCTVREGLAPVRRYQKVEVHRQQKVLVQVNSGGYTCTGIFFSFWEGVLGM